MKKTLTIILISTCTLLTFGQGYYPLIEDNKTWNVLNIISTGGWPPLDTSYNTSSYYISGDSIINNIQYKKLYETNEEIPVTWNLRGLIREDSAKRVWLRWPMNANEELLYDFSLSIGDSLILRNDTSIYYSVDSISIVNINGDTRNKYWISQDDLSWQESWIEGIGSSKGITKSGMAKAVGGWSWLLCMSDTGQLVFINPNYNTCYLNSTAIKESNKLLFQIFPNPTKDKIVIENKENITIKSISILNVTGQIIKHFDHRETHLDISNISSGVVFLRISTNKGDVIKKILVE
jgi:hypothetical protein